VFLTKRVVKTMPRSDALDSRPVITEAGAWSAWKAIAPWARLERAAKRGNGVNRTRAGVTKAKYYCVMPDSWLIGRPPRCEWADPNKPPKRELNDKPLRPASLFIKLRLVRWTVKKEEDCESEEELDEVDEAWRWKFDEQLKTLPNKRNNRL
jgi:hypothetical protein